MSELKTLEIVGIIYALHKRKQKKREMTNFNRRYWVHPLNLKRPREGQFELIFCTLRQYPEEFFKYFRMSISSLDELVSKSIIL